MTGIRRRLQKLEEISTLAPARDWYKEVYDAALLKLSTDQRHLIESSFSGNAGFDPMLCSWWEAAVELALVETKCPFRIYPADWWY